MKKIAHNTSMPLASLPTDTSVILDEDTTSSSSSSEAVCVATTASMYERAVSPQPSQVMSTQCSLSLSQQPLVSTSQSQPLHLSRQRPRFHTVQDLNVALNQAIEGKITSKNAWVSREASDLL
uniref:Leucyl/phenylalanyl-tRNA--protein transferase n=1 Tax=Lygus hesperus TaxID=30085 RepID=A0A0A9ZE16_LYGHE